MLNKTIITSAICIFLLFISFTANSRTSHYRHSHHVTHSMTKSHSKHHRGYAQSGKRYRVLHSSKNYREKGFASWYGLRFNRKRTSSGERFNMYRMTAAHKTLPLPTYVEVTNLRNNRKIIVKVNDRGPFVSNRLIDLSYAAAKNWEWWEEV